MLTLTQVAPAHAFISRRNPAAKLGVAALTSITVLASTDWLTPALMLAIALIVVPFTGVSLPKFAHRLRFLWLAALSVAVISALFAADKTGSVLLDLGPYEVTVSSVQTGAALGLRVMAVALPGVLVFATTDPTELADSLVQQLKVSPRFAIGALAAVRLLPLLAVEWQMIAMARRARGLDAGWNPAARIRLFTSTMFALLVGAIRRGTRLATAMDARGFDSELPRTIARPQRITTADWWMLAGTALVCAAVLSTSISLGVFESIFG